MRGLRREMSQNTCTHCIRALLCHKEQTYLIHESIGMVDALMGTDMWTRSWHVGTAHQTATNYQVDCTSMNVYTTGICRNQPGLKRDLGNHKSKMLMGSGVP